MQDSFILGESLSEDDQSIFEFFYARFCGYNRRSYQIGLSAVTGFVLVNRYRTLSIETARI